MDSITASENHNRDEVANSKCAKYYLNRARTNLKMNQYMFAYEDAEEALTLDP
ncbi:5014_t:CDS:2, partial [Acaulospora colombiana]